VAVRPERDVEQLAAGIMAADEENLGHEELLDLQADVAVPGMGAAGEGLSLRDIMRRYGALPILVLTTLNFVDEIDRIALITLGPEIQRTFGLSDAALGAIAGLSGFVVVLASIPIGVNADRYRRVPLLGR
jgi:hypothetical protein